MAPSEILKCHPGNDNLSFDRTLNPKLSPTSVLAFEKALLENAPDLSNSNLKKLVNSFVNEDKARLAAQRTEGGSAGRCSPSIASTLQKFENPSESPPSYKLATSSRSPVNTPTSGISSSSYSSSEATSSITNLFPKSEQNQKVLFQIPDVLKDTIEQCAKRQKPETPVKPNHLLNHVPQWPLKKKSSLSKTNAACDNENQKIEYNSQYSLNASDQKNDIDVMDEVSREEEKLINALKTGTVLSSDSLPEVISSSFNEYKLQTEQLLNGISSKSRKMAQGNVNNDTLQSQQPQPPQKPNHTPIYVPPKEENTRGFSSFSRIGVNTRIPNRHEISKLDEKKFELKSIPSPVRPFLSRGSVAERVLIFEKCPEKAPVRQALQEKPKVSVSLIN